MDSAWRLDDSAASAARTARLAVVAAGGQL